MVRFAHHPYHMPDQKFWYRNHPIHMNGKLHHVDKHLHVWLFCIMVSGKVQP